MKNLFLLSAATLLASVSFAQAQETQETPPPVEEEAQTAEPTVIVEEAATPQAAPEAAPEAAMEEMPAQETTPEAESMSVSEEQPQPAYLESDAAAAKYYRHAESKIHWPHKGILGRYDKAQLQRGFQVYREVCSACHALKYVAFRNLEEIGYSRAQVKALAAEYTYQKIGEFGDMEDRIGIPADYFPEPFPNDNAAKAANGGALPPNASLLVKAREGHEDYTYAILTGYEDAPADVEVDPTKYYNPYFPSLVISMAPPLSDGIVTYADGTEASVDQMAQDVTAFLAWAGDPKAEQRKETGLMVLIFLAAFTFLAMLSYKLIWGPVKRGETHFGKS